MPAEVKRKPRGKLAPYTHKTKASDTQDDAPSASTSTSTTPSKTRNRTNLTLQDWMTVFAFVDSHPEMGQTDIVRHFKTRPDGPIAFEQPTLSRKLKARAALEARVQSNPNALSSKRPRVVTRPDVERALVLWHMHMEEKRETVTVAMIQEKRKIFEDAFNVPMEERLMGEGWVPSFCRAYRVNERRKHVEPAPVDLPTEQARIREILSSFAVKDRWNFGETSLFAFAPPERSFATNGARSQITLGFACNADGSERLPIFFIGKHRNPSCFENCIPAQRGHYYRSSKNAWMTSELFEEWIRSLDISMRSKNRKICLLLNDFSGHNIAYEPTNIRLEWFAPNLAPRVQPLDAGIIRCFKARYRRGFCLRAIDRYDSGENEIFKLNLLEVMHMANEAWDDIRPATIQQCWNHTAIQHSPIIRRDPQNTGSIINEDTAAWNIVLEYATTEMTLPEVKSALRKHLGEHYVEDEWQPVLIAVGIAEGDVEMAVAAVDKLKRCSSLTSPSPSRCGTTPQGEMLERELLDAIAELKLRDCIPGIVPTVEELVNAVEEQIGDSPYRFEGGDDEIVAEVQLERAIACGEDVEVESDSEGKGGDKKDKQSTSASRIAMLDLCQQLEAYCREVDAECATELRQNLCRFRAHIRREQRMEMKQTRLTSWFKEGESSKGG